MTNEQAISYARLAGRNIGLTKQQIIDIRFEMLHLMDTIYETEAEEKDDRLTIYGE